jgi:NarL family two-component system response regulator LiaR
VNKIGILIVDDHPVVRQGIISFLEIQDELEVKGEAADGEEAIRVTEELKPDVVLMDISMPRVDGIEAIRQIKSLRPETRIIVLTSFAENNKVWPAMEAGADGYLLKGASLADLVKAIKSVYNGEPAIHPDIARKLMLHVSNRNKVDTEETLTPREWEVLELIAQGLSNEEIANNLFISLHTVKTHVHNIFRKLDITHRVQAALYAVNENMHQPDTSSCISQRN